MKNVTLFRLVGSIFVATGVLLLGVAAFLHHRDASFAAAAARATGQVVALHPSVQRDAARTTTRYASRIRFRTEQGCRVDFVEAVASTPPRHAVGEHVAILYDPNRPSRALVDDFAGRKTAFAIVGGLGALFLTIGGTLLAVLIRTARKDARLLREGRPIQAQFLHVFLDEALTINGRHPFRVAAQSQDPVTGTLRRYDSAPIWVDPTDRLTGKSIAIFLGRGQDYRMDLRGIVDETARA